ncbi:MAG: TetR/AcrR family transcriptional regulator [Ktedonobacterales bacterium]
MDVVAAEASVSHGLAYRYFANKEAIFRELVEQALQGGSAILQRLSERSGTSGERLFFLVSSLVESRRKHRSWAVSGSPHRGNR